jgi:MYXO-CTERM domain-containing protein
MTTTLRTSWVSLVATTTVLLGTGLAAAQSITVDHTTVDVSVLDSDAIAAAAALRMSFSHASVGGNIWGGLTALAEQNSAYAFPNWTDNDRGNPGWEAKIADFETWVADHESEYDVFQNKFCFIDQNADFATYRDSMIGLESSYPDKTIVWWTMPITTEDGSNSLRADFNGAVRGYCAENDCVLFDIADIESHTASGDAVTVAGVEALDPAQATDDGGHLEDAGPARMAAAQWLLMAAIAGVDVEGSCANDTCSASGSAGSGGAETTDESSADSGDSGCSVSSHPSRRSTGGAIMAALVLAGLCVRRRMTAP